VGGMDGWMISKDPSFCRLRNQGTWKPIATITPWWMDEIYGWEAWRTHWNQ
jgi:hypothetical protein